MYTRCSVNPPAGLAQLISAKLSRALIVLLATLAALPAGHAQDADIIITGRHILTMDATTEGSTAVAIRGDRIVAVSDRESVMRHRAANTRIVELGDRALLPGFIDAHGHALVQAKVLGMANLSPPPVGTVRSIDDIAAVLTDYIRQREVPEGQWVVGFGYDESLLAEGRHPERQDLDLVSDQHPVVLLHASGHLAAANSMALEVVGITEQTADPAGGVIRRRAGTTVPDGVLEESAMVLVYRQLPQPSTEDAVEQLVAVQQFYASHGITTVQEGGATPADIAVYRAAAQQGRLILDSIAYVHWVPGTAPMPAPGAFGEYAGRFRLGGIKLVLDGSPQAKTAYLSQPYAVPPHGHDHDYRGYPAFPAEVVDQAVHDVLEKNIQLLAHANGDAAAELLIDAVDAASRTLTLADPRVVMIHAQTVRDDQLDRMAGLGIMPSFFTAHTYFWGDWHRESVLGPVRGDRISPTRSALDRGMVFTVHNDAPVTPPVPLDLIWNTVNRRTRSNDILGPTERVSVYEAIRALTINGALQYFEEDRKGSIAPGKLADLVILSQDPLTTDPALLRDISVMETLAHGRSVYRREP